jgi:hypothetical protein
MDNYYREGSGSRVFVVANNRRQERRGFGGTAQQQPESPFPAGQTQYPHPRRNEFTSQQKAGRQENGRDGPWRHGERDPARMGGGRGFAANNRSQEGRGFSDTAPQQPESPFPAGQKQYPHPRRNESTNQQKAGRQEYDRGGPWRPGERAPVRMGGGGGFAASNRRQDGVWGTAPQQPESPFPARQKQYPNPRLQGRDFSYQQKAGPNQMEEDADYSGHPESRERKKLLQHLLAIESPKDRRNEFEKLSPGKRLSLVLDVNIASLPSQHVPLNWDEVQEKATVATKEWIKEEFGSLVEEDSESGYSSDGIYGKRNHCKPELPYLDFSDTLRHCSPMTSGFHNKDQNGAFCYCPCGKKMADWRKVVGVQDFLEQTDRYGADKLCKSRMTPPRQLLQHVEAKKEGCMAHAIIWVFLFEVKT